MTEHHDLEQTNQRSEPRKTGLSHAWSFVVVAALSGLIVIAFGIGFLLLPNTKQYAHHSFRDNIEHALGKHNMKFMPSAMADSEPEHIPTHIVWDEVTLQQARGGNADRGEFVATNCGACHGDQGRTPIKGIPNLAGLDKIYVYKQLSDFSSGTRLSAPMSAIAQSLSSRDWADVAAYYAAFKTEDNAEAHSVPVSGRSYHTSDPILRLLYAGDEKRGLAGCTSCHGPGSYRLGSPPLQFQNAKYVEDQLHAFKQGTRRNDMNMPMRMVAGMLTDDEITQLAQKWR